MAERTLRDCANCAAPIEEGGAEVKDIYYWHTDTQSVWCYLRQYDIPPEQQRMRATPNDR